MTLDFFKYQGTGNDFVIMDNRSGNIDLTDAHVKHICNRRFGIGADGLMLLNSLEGYDFEMKYYNSDGKQSSIVAMAVGVWFNLQKTKAYIKIALDF